MPGKTFFAPQTSGSSRVFMITACVGDEKATHLGGFFVGDCAGLWTQLRWERKI
jgi:hypothetical protein